MLELFCNRHAEDIEGRVLDRDKSDKFTISSKCAALGDFRTLKISTQCPLFHGGFVETTRALSFRMHLPQEYLALFNVV